MEKRLLILELIVMIMNQSIPLARELSFMSGHAELAIGVTR